MRALQDSRLHSPAKNISIDNYDTDSDEEDQLREEEEIKRIITQAKARGPLKPKNLKVQLEPDQTPFTPKPKLPVFTNLKSNSSSKLKSSKGFFYGMSVEHDSNIRINADEGISKMIDPRGKAKKNQKSKPDFGVDLRMAPVDYAMFKTDADKSPSKRGQTKLPEIVDQTKNQDFHKESFKNLLNLYERSTSNVPMRLFTDKINSPKTLSSSASKPGSPVKRSNNVSKMNSRIGSPENKVKQSVIFEAGEVHETDHAQNLTLKDTGNLEGLEAIIPDLITAVLRGAYEPLDKKAPHEIPRIKALDWPTMLKKANTQRLEMLIMNPVTFSIEETVEISAEADQDIKEKIHEALKEVTPSTNEAKLILMYYYDADTNERKLLFTKYFFFLKNHRHYGNDFKNEKEVISYYHFVLGLLVFRIAYENNPFKDGKIEEAKRKAYSIVKKKEALPAFLCNWLIDKIQPMIAIEKVYINLNVGGKADSNFNFSLHEHLVYSFPRFSKALHGPKHQIVEPSTSTTSKTVAPASASANLPAKDLGPLRLIREDTFEQRSRDNKSFTSSKRLELSPCIVDFFNVSREEDTLRSFNYKSDQTQNISTSFIKSIPNTPTAKIPISSFGKEAVGSGLAPRTWDKDKDDVIQWRGQPQGYVTLSSHFREKAECKMSLSMQRMNTTYNELIRQRYGKKRLW